MHISNSIRSLKKDGPTPAAGAVVDGQTVIRGEAMGLDAEVCLLLCTLGETVYAYGHKTLARIKNENLKDNEI